MMLRPGDNIGGCTILEDCGRGAYGQVFLAVNALGQRVAVKKLLTEEAGDYELKGLRNYLSVSSEAPGLLRVFHCGMDNGLPFYVMEAADNASEEDGKYVPDTLSLRLGRMGRLPAQESLDICHSILDGLESMHDAGLLHRDVKPENVVFVNGQPKLADPGLTRRFEQTLSVAGTPGYIAPEFYKGESKAAPTTDIYALGKLLYHIVTGKPPSEFPDMPDDMPVEELYQICSPLMKLCEPSPKKRCQSAAEVRMVLPKSFVRHNAVQRFRDALAVRPSFRRRVVRRLSTALAVLAFLACGVAVFHKQLRIEAAAHAERQAGLLTELEALESLRPRLELQFRGELAVCSEERLRSVRNGIREDGLSQAEEALKAIKSDLVSYSLSMMPAISQDSDFAACANGYGYLSSPLGLMLPKKERDEYSGMLSDLAAKLSGGNNNRTIVLGQNYTEDKDYPFTLVFVPPGRFVSPYLKAEREIPYPYWILESELDCKQFASYTKIPPTRNSPECAVEYLCQNDALRLCRDLNMTTERYCSFPKGYGIRIPTEEEWEFAAVGGWDGKLPTPRDIPAGAKCSAPNTENANAIGVCGMDDNLSELCLAYPNSDTPEVHCVVRGSSYKSKTTGITTRYRYRRDQVNAKGLSGLRPVLAPIDDGYWKREWYRGPAINSEMIDGYVYAGWSVCACSTSWTQAVELANSIGASLPESCDPSEIKRIISHLGLEKTFPCFIGIRLVDGKWMNVSTNTPADVPVKLGHDPKTPCLGFEGNGPFKIMEEIHLPTIIFRWADEAAFNRRLESWLENAGVASFDAGGRHFVVCKAVLGEFLVRSFSQFMGARQPVFASSEELNEVVGKIPHGLAQTALGPIRYYREWEQPDGSILPQGIDIDDSELSRTPMNSKMHTVLTATNGKICQSFVSKYILVEVTK